MAGKAKEYRPDKSAGKFRMLIAEEGVPTADGREFAADSISWREPPLTLLFIRQNNPTGNGGHKGATAVGTITKVWKEVNDETGFAKVYGEGYFTNDEEGQEAYDLIKEGVINRVSADTGGCVVETVEVFDAEGDSEIRRIYRQGEIIAVTALALPAFADTKINVVASSGPTDWRPKAEWFKNPNFTKPTPITVTEDGRVFGHAAVWGTCHVGYRDRCVTPPRSRSNYSFFNVGQVQTDDGSFVNVGRLTAGTNHADLEFGANPAKEHYDNTGWAAAYVQSGEDSHGIWFAGTLSPTATKEQIATLRAASVSGDWRAINGALELVGILAVNSPGFPIPRAQAGIVAGAQISLIASGVCPCESDDTIEPEMFTIDESTTEESSAQSEFETTVREEEDSEIDESGGPTDVEFGGVQIVESSGLGQPISVVEPPSVAVDAEEPDEDDELLDDERAEVEDSVDKAIVNQVEAEEAERDDDEDDEEIERMIRQRKLREANIRVLDSYVRKHPQTWKK